MSCSTPLRLPTGNPLTRKENLPRDPPTQPLVPRLVAVQSEVTATVDVRYLVDSGSRSGRRAVLAVPDYTYDVFVSYRRSGAGNVREWVHNHFHPLLVDCLADVLPHQPDVFLDIGVETGAHWPSLLADTLQGSRMMVAVCSPQYFQSNWCQAEWATMSAREQVCGLARRGRPHGLIYPVVFSDGEHFPPEVATRQAYDLKSLAFPHLAFKHSHLYLDFHAHLQTIADEVAALLRKVPQRAPGWPVSRPKNLVPVAPVAVPRPWGASAR